MVHIRNSLNKEAYHFGSLLMSKPYKDLIASLMCLFWVGLFNVNAHMEIQTRLAAFLLVISHMATRATLLTAI
jgi:hypothetical protein